jgi:NitT/TauT family transport system permease protein
LPKIVLAPLLIGWLGFGTPSKVAIAVAICFFPVWIDTMVGMSLPTADEFKLMAALKASRWQMFRMLQFPSALPLVMVGIKHAMLLSFTGVLVAEILAASAGGLGTLAEQFANQLLMPLTFAVVLVVVVLAIALVSILDYVEQRVVFWSEAARGEGR